MTPETLDLELRIEKPPASVRAWWTEYPDDYRAEDPREQPQRIMTAKRFRNGRDLRTFWKMPDGSTVEAKEVLNLKGDGSWIYDVPHPNATGISVHDEFVLNQRPTELEPGGSDLRTRCTLTDLD